MREILSRISEGGPDIRSVQDLLGHVDVATTQVYTHVMNRPVTRKLKTVSGQMALHRVTRAFERQGFP
ncbi:MAG: hypothetical protein C5B50_16560 [Verrucomicrobia bacterium]|nr:MAG: hypothetical protein C5B50_16560 [Verrucomicrobiota bacterium]